MVSTVKKTLVATFIIYCCATPSTHAATVSVTSTGNPASFSVDGTGMDGVAGIQLDISYDAGSLSTPTVTQGGLVAGAMLAANTSQPGLIKIAIISPRVFSGSGQIATITFASKTGSGGITSITTSMIDIKGSALASSTSNLSEEAVNSASPGVSPFSQPSSSAQHQEQQGGSTTVTSNTVTSSTPTYPGTITLPTDLQQRSDSQPSIPSTPPAYSGEPPATIVEEQIKPAGKPTADAKPEETPQYVVYKGIIDRFRLYSGNKTLSAMAALFEKKVAKSINQEPAILLSDGQSKATLSVDIPARIAFSPNFAVNGGTLVSFKQDKQIKGRWIVDVLPEAGTIRVSVTIITGTEEFEFPLTVAPPVKTALTLDERGWSRFIEEVGTNEAPLHDLNKDGVRDYKDEFIFIANLLASKSTPAKSALTHKKTVK